MRSIPLSKEELLHAFTGMSLIRQFETRAEVSYQQGKIGGFFHSYVGQEAIQTAVLQALGPDHYYTTTYRCHALALLLGVSPAEAMAELYGKVTGNALGRGGSMHLFSERMLGGFGIVGGHVPLATGAGFSIKYRGLDEVSVCFLGDGAVAQGAFHESLNLASIWDLPCIYVIENNQWGMGTHVNRALAPERLAESFAKGYEIRGETVDGLDFFACYNCFKEAHAYVKKNKRPILIEAVTQRFRGHSISDPGLYRSKEELKAVSSRDPILHFKKSVLQEGLCSEEELEKIQKEQKARVLEAIEFAEKSPWPEPLELEEGVLAPPGPLPQERFRNNADDSKGGRG